MTPPYRTKVSNIWKRTNVRLAAKKWKRRIARDIIVRLFNHPHRWEPPKILAILMHESPTFIQTYRHYYKPAKRFYIVRMRMADTIVLTLLIFTVTYGLPIVRAECVTEETLSVNSPLNNLALSPRSPKRFSVQYNGDADSWTVLRINIMAQPDSLNDIGIARFESGGDFHYPAYSGTSLSSPGTIKPLANNLAYGEFQNNGYLILMGPDLLANNKTGCLELMTYNGSAISHFDVSLEKVSMSWLGTGIAWAVMISIGIIAIGFYIRHPWRPVRSCADLRRLLFPAGLVPTLPVFASVIVLVFTIGALRSRFLFNDLFLRGYQDTCSYDFKNFFGHGLLASLDSLTTHIGYFTFGFMLLIIIWIEHYNSECCLVCQGTHSVISSGMSHSCWHWKVLGFHAISLFMVGNFSIVYHLCNDMYSVTFDYTGQTMAVVIGHILLYMSRGVNEAANFGEFLLLMLAALSIIVAGATYGTLLAFKVFMAIGLTAYCLFLLWPFIVFAHDSQQRPLFSTVHVYSEKAQFVALLVERVLIISVAVIVYVLYCLNIVVFDFGFMGNVYGGVLISCLVELVLRSCYRQITWRPIVACTFAFATGTVAVYFLFLPYASYQDEPYISRAIGSGAILDIWDSHDLWHLFSAGMAFSLGLTAIYITDADRAHSPDTSIGSPASVEVHSTGPDYQTFKQTSTTLPSQTSFDV